MEEGNEIIMPPSINMEAQLFDENESERNDYVKSLSLQSIVDIRKNNQQQIKKRDDSLNSGQSSAPYNF